MSSAIILGLLAALFFGATNFVVRFAARGAGVFRTMLYGQWLAAPFFTGAVLVRGLPHAPAPVWGVLILSDLLLLAATALVIRALSHGRIAVVAPIAASYGGITAIIAALAGAHLGLAQGVAVASITLGCILAARRPDASRTTGGALPALGAASLFGIAYWLQGRFVVAQLGTLAPVWSYYLLGSAVMPVIACALRIPLAPPPRAALLWIGLTTLLASAAYLFLTWGLATPFPVIATALSALASGVTVFLAYSILKERAHPAGWIGLSAVIAGLILLRAA